MEDSHHVGSGRWKIPAGSLVVDAALVFSLIWWGGTITEKLTTVAERVERLENVDITPEASRRIAVLEAAQARADADRREIMDKLDTIDDKITAHMTGQAVNNHGK